MPVPPDPDAVLMLRVKRGDRAAFAELVEKYKQPVMNLVYRTLHDEAEAEDLAQNVFLQVYKSAKRYESRAKFSTWLFTIARNLCLNEIRRRCVIPPIRLMKATLNTRTSHASNSRTKPAFRRRKSCCTANWRKKSRRRWPGCRKTSAPPFCSADRRN